MHAYIHTHDGPKKVPILYSLLFFKCISPCRRTIGRLVDIFLETGYVGNKNKEHSGGPCSARTPDKVDTVRNRLEESPRTCTRRLSQEVGIAITSDLRILHNDLSLFPHKIQIPRRQTDRNNQERLAFCQDVSERIEDNPGLQQFIFFSDEAHSHLSGHVNKQNLPFWYSEQPHEYIQPSFSQEKVTVW